MATRDRGLPVAFPPRQQQELHVRGCGGVGQWGRGGAGPWGSGAMGQRGRGGAGPWGRGAALACLCAVIQMGRLPLSHQLSMPCVVW